MKAIITILARSGSKGLPNKHLLPFNGKPLIQWTIEQAIAYGNGDFDIIVASDSNEVRTLAKDLGIHYSMLRSPEFATDKAGKVAAIRDVLKRYGKFNSQNIDMVIDLDATNPCRRLEDIEICRQIFKKKRPKILFSVVKSKKNGFFNQITRCYSAAGIKKDFCLVGEIDRIKMDRYLCRQDAPETFDMNCNIYIYDANWLRDENNKSVITNDSEIYIMPDWSFCDIDNEIDFQMAEFLHRKYILDA